jgi:hypothetical protein
MQLVPINIIALEKVNKTQCQKGQWRQQRGKGLPIQCQSKTFKLN